MRIANDDVEISDVYNETIMKSQRVGLEQPFNREEYISDMLNGRMNFYASSVQDVANNTMNRR